MTSNVIVAIVLVFGFGTLFPFLIWLSLLLVNRLFPPKEFTIVSRKTGKVVTLKMKEENDAEDLLEFGRVFLGKE
ncbi:hypothetical protein [Chitinophaga deserti]|uniref:hypothetical protein n=1 Tax=Chitinophaga deserti TaxID=2164099 RepID=UPI000D6C4D08|nr:hypothetical protein [Chitinophaga deserti]